VAALNAFVSELVTEKGGSIGSTLGHASRRFSGVEAFRRAGLVRVRTQSRVPHLLTYVGWARCVGVGEALILFLGGFKVRISWGFVLSIMGFGYP
jgi:hypothetical protein